MRDRERFDAIVVGAGIIGLATAWELAKRGFSVCLVERGKVGGEASWAGAGIIYPAFPHNTENAFDRLRGESYATWPEFVAGLDADVGFLRCGGIVLASTDAEIDAVAAEHHRAGAIAERCRPSSLEPHLDDRELFACHLPEVCQVRNPRLLRALQQKLESLGASIVESDGVERCLASDGRIEGIETASGAQWFAERVLLSAGAWTAGLLPGLTVDIEPVRGQILLFRPKGKLLARVVEVGKHYLVPRADGRVLAGSTEEHVGFQKGLTPDAFDELYSFATRLVPALADAEIEASWSGLRPGTPSGTPYLFEDDTRKGLWIAAGHFRLGVQLATGTAMLLADWMTGEPGFASPSDFGPNADRSRYRRSFLV